MRLTSRSAIQPGWHLLCPVGIFHGILPSRLASLSLQNLTPRVVQRWLFQLRLQNSTLAVLSARAVWPAVPLNCLTSLVSVSSQQRSLCACLSFIHVNTWPIPLRSNRRSLPPPPLVCAPQRPRAYFPHARIGIHSRAPLSFRSGFVCYSCSTTRICHTFC